MSGSYLSKSEQVFHDTQVGVQFEFECVHPEFEAPVKPGMVRKHGSSEDNGGGNL